MSYTIPPASERRIAPRFRPTVGTICRLGEQNLVGLVWNISSTGISMMIATPPPIGTRLAAELSAEGGIVMPLELHVVHVKLAETGDYLLGGRFDVPLSEADMRRFLAPGSYG